MTEWHEYPKELPVRTGQSRSEEFLVTDSMGRVIIDSFDFLYEMWVGTYNGNVVAWAIKPEPYKQTDCCSTCSPVLQ